MTSLKMWSSGSINKLALVLVGLALGGSGCATQTRPAPLPPVRGFANLDALMHRHPGWNGVSQYDAALSRLNAAARSLPPMDRPDEKIATLPALARTDSMTAGVLPPGAVKEIGSRLGEVQQSLLGELRNRREIARQDQVRSQRDIWQREARQRFAVPAETTALRPDLELQLLQANVVTLTRTLNNWKQSTPPAPKRDALRVKVEAERTRLEALLASRLQAREASRAQYLQDVQHMREARRSYVQTQDDTLAARLRADDERVIADQQSRLTQQRAALLGALAQPASIAVPVVGDAGEQTLPKGQGAPLAALSKASLTAAETHLKAQRARWLKFLQDDTQAAARDMAGQQNWDVTFGPPRPGDQDLTQRLAQAMNYKAQRL